MKLFAELHPDYPRPQFTRNDWLSLNGKWGFAFDDGDRGLADGWQDRTDLEQEILVPFPYQSEKSGINDKEIHEVVWYSRTFDVPADWTFESLLLHFCAVDYETTVWLNGHWVGNNRGGHVPFHFDIAPYLVDGTNHISLRVEDCQDPSQPRGKQSSSGKPVRIYYYCTTGIWQTVWLEPVSGVRIDNLRITSDADSGAVQIDAHLHAPFGNYSVELDVFAQLDADEPLTRVHMVTNTATASVKTNIANPRLWSTESPHLYKIQLRLFHGDKLVDSVESYFGIRSFELLNSRFLLNKQDTFLLMILDQGYWPDTLLASPSPQALHDDVKWVKRFGFNAVRKHQKIEDQRWLYYCDREGLLVWEEMPNARSWSLEAEERLLSEWERAISRDINHPCIVTWVAVVESLGFPGLHRPQSPQYAFLERIVMRTHELDPTRPVIDNDGWEHTDMTDICSIHDYSQPSEVLLARYAEAQRTGQPPMKGWYKDKPLFLRGGAYRGQPIVLSEVGGFLTTPPATGAEEKRDRLFDYYGTIDNADQFMAKYRDLMQAVSSLTVLAGACYTQLTDVEHETNGLLSYDRQPKVTPEQIAKLHAELFVRPGHSA